jgi:outer membrane protein assembly factor BamD (BamD/ComL family)
MRKRQLASTILAGLVVCVAILPGCAAPESNTSTATPAKPSLEPLKSKDIGPTLTEAYAAFERKQYDAAYAGAERVLASNPTGTGAAEAQYLRGRVFEERAQQASANGDVAGAKANLQSARDAYNAALTTRPSPDLEGRIQAGLANVAYFQEDYSTAIAAWTASYGKLTEPQTKAWVLYRIGLSQQRFGQFPEADKTFAQVQQEHPNTEPARRAAAHAGVKGFQVQVGAYSTPANADAAIAALRADGVIGTRVTDNSGKNVVRVGPMRTYDEAKVVKARLAAKYPDAMIIP